MKYLNKYVIALFCLLMFNACQSEKHHTGYAWIEGYVSDFKNNQSIGKAEISLNDSIYRTLTDSTGYFKFDSILSGVYNLNIKAYGYQQINIANIPFSDRQKYSLKISLKEDWLVTEKIQVTDFNNTAARNYLYVPHAIFQFAREPLGSNQLERLPEPQSSLGLDYIGGIRSLSLAGAGQSGMASTNLGVGCVSYMSNYWNWWNSMYNIQFKKTKPHDFIKTQVNNISTFGADVSTASYTMVKKYIMKNGALPPVDAVRTEELLNYFDLNYPAPNDRLFAIHTNLHRSVINQDSYLMQIGVQAKILKPEERAPLQIIYVIDVSGSMAWDLRYQLVVQTLEMLTKQTGPRDKIGIVTYGTGTKLILEPTLNKDTVLALINRLSFNEDYTNAEAGLVKAYQLLDARFDTKAIHHIILCTDGMANKGQTASSDILKRIETQRQKGIYLTACGFGMNNFNDAGLEELATRGDGSYYYIAAMDNAKRVFVDQFLSTTQIIARDVAIQLEFDKNVVSEFRLFGYEKRDIKNEQFRKDVVQGGEIGSGHHVTALYELRLKDTTVRSAGWITLRYRTSDKKDTIEQKDSLLLRVSATKEEDDIYRFISAVALFSEIVKQSPSAKARSIKDVRELLKQTGLSFRRQCPQYEDFAELVYRSIQITEPRKGWTQTLGY
jgi:Ca-activated chloride channel homolog